MGLATVMLSRLLSYIMLTNYGPWLVVFSYCIVVSQLTTPTVWCVQNWLCADSCLVIDNIYKCNLKEKQLNCGQVYNYISVGINL